MKQKTKKLTLSKQTVAHLKIDQMNDARGGYKDPPTYTCIHALEGLPDWQIPTMYC